MAGIDRMRIQCIATQHSIRPRLGPDAVTRRQRGTFGKRDDPIGLFGFGGRVVRFDVAVELKAEELRRFGSQPERGDGLLIAIDDPGEFLDGGPVLIQFTIPRQVGH